MTEDNTNNSNIQKQAKSTSHEINTKIKQIRKNNQEIHTEYWREYARQNNIYEINMNNDTSINPSSHKINKKQNKKKRERHTNYK